MCWTQSGQVLNTCLVQTPDLSRWLLQGPGLYNIANTCYMNSVLQCLTHTPPLAEALLTGRQWEPGDGSEPLSITQQHIIRALRSRTAVITPMSHANTLRRVCSRFPLAACRLSLSLCVCVCVCVRACVRADQDCSRACETAMPRLPRPAVDEQE